MAIIESVSVSQTKSVSVQHRVEASAQQSVARVEANVLQSPSNNNFERVFDLVDISEEAKQKLLQDHVEALVLADNLKTRGTFFGLNSSVSGQGGGSIRVSGVAASESYQLAETFSASYAQDTTIEIETDEGRFSISYSKAAQAELASSIEVERRFGSLTASFR